MLEERPLEDVALSGADLVVSAHACGPLTDVILTGGAKYGLPAVQRILELE